MDILTVYKTSIYVQLECVLAARCKRSLSNSLLYIFISVHIVKSFMFIGMFFLQSTYNYLD
jgi:hypothetical protein